MRDADRSAAVGDTIAELVDRLGLVQTGQAEVVVRSVHGDVLVLVLVERSHEGLEVSLATLLSHVGGGEVRVHARTVPIHILAQGLAVKVHVDAVLLTQAHEHVTGDPNLISGGLGALAEDLEFPLALGHFGVDALVVDTGIEALFEVLLDDFACDVTDGLVANAGVVLALGIGEIVGTGGETQRTAIPVQEVFLLEAKPGARVIENGRTGVRGVRGHAIGHHHFAHHQRTVLAGAVGIDGHRLQHAVRAAALGLTGGAAVEIPERQLLELREALEFLDLGFAAEVGDWLVTIEPDVFQFVFSHGCEW